MNELELSDQAVAIGRDARCDLVLPDPSVSRDHATIEPNGNFYVIRDNDSTNGTFVNDHIIGVEVLQLGDAIRIGKYVLKVVTVKRRRGDTSKVRIKRLKSQRGTEDPKSDSKSSFRSGVSADEAALLGERERLLRLYEIHQELGYIDRLSSLLDHSLERMLKELAADSGCILLADLYYGDNAEKPAKFEPAAVAYVRDGRVYAEGEELVVPHEFIQLIQAKHTGALLEESDSDGSSVKTPAVGAPFICKGRIQGIVFLRRVSADNPFYEEDLQFLTLIASVVSVNLANTLLFEKVSSEKEKLGAVISGLTDGVLVTDAEFRIVDASTLATSLLLQEENLIGRSFFDLLGDFEISMEASLIRSEIEHGGSLFHLAEAGEDWRSLSVRIMPFVGRRSGIRGCIIILRNATELRRIERLKTAFIGMIAHKLRTPLTVIEGNLPLLRTAIAKSAPEAEILHDVERNSRSLCDLVNGFVDFMELEIQTTRSLLSTALLSPKEIIRRSLRKVEGRATEKRILLADRLPDDLPRIRADENRLSEAMAKLLDNAVKFSPEMAVVTLQGEKVDGVLKIHIIDEGPGIPAQDQEAAFQVFQQLDREFTGEVPGLGLGLAIARQIIQELGGGIQITSPFGFANHGTRVSVLLPLTPEITGSVEPETPRRETSYQGTDAL